MTRIPNDRLSGHASLRPDLARLKEANKVVQILSPEKVSELESLLTQPTVSKAELRQARKILDGGRAVMDRDKDDISLRLADEAGIDWKPADGWQREVSADLLAFGASTVLLQGSAEILRGQFPKTALDDLSDAAAAAGRILLSIPVGIAVGLAAMVSTVRGDSGYTW